jgi:hypothetical protein
MEQGIDLGPRENGPHAEVIRGLAERCYADAAVQAIWVGGSLAAGTGDPYSDVDLRIAVAHDRLERWVRPDWEHLLPLPSCGGTFMRFGEHALLHHLLLTDGTLVDLFVQDLSVRNPEPELVVLACRDEDFGNALVGSTRTPAPIVHEVEAESVRQLFIDYWITTYKEIKGLSRGYDHAAFVGLYFERSALLRAWHLEIVGKDIDARLSIHVLGAMHEGFDGRLTAPQLELLGLPSRTPEETVTAIEAIRTEMARLGRSLAEAHGFRYPHDLEDVVLRAWESNRRTLTRR